MKLQEDFMPTAVMTIPDLMEKICVAKSERKYHPFIPFEKPPETRRTPERTQLIICDVDVLAQLTKADYVLQTMHRLFSALAFPR